MDPVQLVHPTAAGLTCAISAIVAGAPIFSDGLRSLRLRRHLAGLVEEPIAACPAGFVHVGGAVTLESPMFAPLSSAPCAGFRLEVRAVGTPVAKALEVRRPFRVAAGGASARVHSTGGCWSLSTTAEREVAADEPLTESLARLLGQVPGALWWRRVGGRLRLVERALLAGSPCHVVGFARRAHAPGQPVHLEAVRTGTDVAFDLAAAATPAQAPELCLGPGEFLDFLYVSDRAPAIRDLSVPRWRTLGAFVGPVLSLLGLLYLAGLAEHLRALGRF